MGEINTVLSYKTGALARLGSPVRPPLLFGPSNTLGYWGGTWVRIPFTNWHASDQITLHIIFY